METPNRIVEENDTSLDYLQPTSTINADHPAVIAFARRVIGRATDPLEQATRLYLAVRDDFDYDPYKFDFSVAGMQASRGRIDCRRRLDATVGYSLENKKCL